MKQQPKKKPLGTAIQWSDEDIEHLSTITPADKKAAQALWHNEAPTKLKNLLSAGVEGNK